MIFPSVLHIFSTIDSYDVIKQHHFLGRENALSLKSPGGIISIISPFFLHISDTINC